MSFVTYEPQGAVAYLIINRPEALNALNSQVLADLDAALDAIDLDAVRCLIVRGAGEKSFGRRRGHCADEGAHQGRGRELRQAGQRCDAQARDPAHSHHRGGRRLRARRRL